MLNLLKIFTDFDLPVDYCSYICHSDFLQNLINISMIWWQHCKYMILTANDRFKFEEFCYYADNAQIDLR